MNSSCVSVFSLMVLFLAPHFVQSARILTVFPIVSKSHFAVGQSLSLGLASSGHNVTFACVYDYKSPVANMEVVHLTGLEDMAREESKHVSSVDAFDMPAAFIIGLLSWKGSQYTEDTLTHPNVRRLMDNRSFDLVIVEIFGTEATVGLGQHFGTPVIGVSTFGASKWTNDLVGNPAPLSFVPHAFSSYPSAMTFWQRLGNTAIQFYEHFINSLMHHRLQRPIYEKAFPNAKITYDQAIKSVSLILLNSHFTINTPRPFVPNMIEVGGMHVNRKTKPLPKNIQTFLDSATEGVIYFSLGTILKSSLMSANHKAIFVKVFGSLQQKVVWKFEEDLKVADNVMISNWLPQNDIFAHPNLKVFISHGGLLSTTEAVFHGLPVTGIPFFGDQKRNIEGYVSSGWALRLDYQNVTEDSLRWALQEVLYKNKYSENARIASKRYRDQPMTPLDTAVYWCEYVIRHDGAPHLRSASMNLSFVEYHNVDALTILTVACGVSVWVTLLALRWCFRKCFGRKNHQLGDTNKKRT